MKFKIYMLMIVPFALGHGTAMAQTAPAQNTTSLKGCAQAIRADELYPGGRLGLNINGDGMTLHLFELANARATHQCFGNRLTNYTHPAYASTSQSLIDHITGMAGVAISDYEGGLNARGIAYKAKAYIGSVVDNSSPHLALDKLPSILEIVVSSHSYAQSLLGVQIGANTTWKTGAYTDRTRASDELSNQYPLWLQVYSAANEGAKVNPTAVTPGFDQLGAGEPAAKNTLTVGGISNVSYNSTTGNVVSATMAPFSSKGPTDDYRIKPEIVAFAQNIIVPNAISDNNYSTSVDGNSLAAPAVAAACLLLQQYYFSLHKRLLGASTLKALALHTADRKVFNNGQDAPPNVTYGYGLMNTMEAAKIITNRLVSSEIVEGIIEHDANGVPGTKTYTVHSNGMPLKVSLSWTDPEGDAVLSAAAANSNPRLKHDLDLRITGNGTTYLPWRLDPKNPTTAVVGDNDRDPYEQIYNANPGQTDYTITVSTKNSQLIDDFQEFALIVTGLNSDNVCTATALVNFPVNDAGPVKANSILISSTINPSKSNGTAPVTSFYASTEVVLKDQALLKNTNASEIILGIEYCSNGTVGAKSGNPDMDLPGSSPVEKQLASIADLYPNPASDDFTLKYFSAASGKAQIRIYNSVGVMVGAYDQPATAGTNKLTIPVRDLATGIYLIRLVLPEGGPVRVMRLAVQH